MITDEEIYEHVKMIKGPVRNIHPVSTVLSKGAQAITRPEERAAILRIAKNEAVYTRLPSTLQRIVDSNIYKSRFA